MGVEKTFGDVVRVFVVVDMFMMAAVFAGPHQDRIFECRRAENERKQAQEQPCPKSRVRKQPVITKRDAEARRGQQHCEQGDVKPINTKIPKVKRHGRKCEDKCADQKRTRRPIDAAGRNTKNQGM